MSYNGQLNFGLTADYDALADVESLAGELHGAIAELADVAGVAHSNGSGSRRATVPTT
jgi:hypothetical protein